MNADEIEKVAKYSKAYGVGGNRFLDILNAQPIDDVEARRLVDTFKRRYGKFHRFLSSLEAKK